MKKTKRTSYETYLFWMKKYGTNTKEILTEKQYEQVKELKKLELKEQNKSTTNLARQIAQESSFTYGYRTGLAIKRAYAEQFNENISLKEARNIMQYGSKNQALRHEIDDKFWTNVSEKYKEAKRSGLNTAEAKALISETIFGSP